MNGGHFKLGLFVTVSVVLLVAFLLTLGVLSRFRPRITAETYFPESIQNLQTGAKVRFRGVEVGVVNWIGFAASRYPEAAPGGGIRVDRSYVMVTMDIYTEMLLKAGVRDVGEELLGAVDRGMRAKLSSTGLGGPTYIEVDFLDPTMFPPPRLDWTPHTIYIPSAPSTVTSILDSLVAILREVEDRSMVTQLITLTEDLQRVLDEAEASALVANTAGAMNEIRSLAGDPRLEGMLDDASDALQGARELLATDQGEVRRFLRDMMQMAETLERAGTSLDALAAAVNEGGLVPRMQAAAEALGPAGRDLSELAARLERLVHGNEKQIADAIRSLRNAALEVQAALEGLKTDPSRILADPPPRRTPGGGS